MHESLSPFTTSPHHKRNKLTKLMVQKAIKVADVYLDAARRSHVCPAMTETFFAIADCEARMIVNATITDGGEIPKGVSYIVGER